MKKYKRGGTKEIQVDKKRDRDELKYSSDFVRSTSECC
jgi:hypothetical protein